ncbi:hypothetical protein [uncultured Duncaniella sp.]|uniref:hypothetical protein n=1 Tax=uncultured Duncaniella sp. TaxID=2768039 RepID=UPI00260D39DE|nr:hypothetical protein [uncultured Duncaniella sp.]
MEEKVLRSITALKPRSQYATLDQQICKVPRNEDQQIYRRTQDYYIGDQRYLVNLKYESCYWLHYIRMCPLFPRDYIAYDHTKQRFDRLVNDSILHPFMLFLDGRFIPWSMIWIVANKEWYWVIIDGTNHPALQPLALNHSRINIVTLPDGVTYDENATGKPVEQDILFAFNREGYYEETSPDITIRNTVDRMEHVHITTDDKLAAEIVTDDQTVKLYEQNICLFRNGIYDSESIIHMDGNMLTVNDGTNENGDHLHAVFSVNKHHSENPDVISKTYPPYVKPMLEAKYSGQEYPPYIDQLLEQFKMRMSQQKWYNQNVLDCIENIMRYDASLFKKAWMDDSNLVIEEYSGQEAIDNCDELGIWKIPRYHSAMIDEFIVVLVNGELYPDYNFCKHITNLFYMPVNNIFPGDRIELLRFQRVCNAILDLVVNEDDPYIAYDPQLINNTMVLFSKETNDDYFDFPMEGQQHFPVGYTIDTNEEGGIKIILDNPFYYGKKLKVAYVNQFRHRTYRLEAPPGLPDEYIVPLGTSFYYCNDYSRYLVFYNGRRLASDQFRLTLPVRSTTPFSEFRIYLTKKIEAGDRLDILYTPSYWKDVILVPEVGITGDIVVDKRLLDYPLDKDLYLCWVNGRKIVGSSLSNIDSTHIRITTDEKSTKNVCLTAYLPAIPELTKAFQENEALWDQITAQLTNDEVYALLNILGEDLTNAEPTMYENSVHVRSVMWELIRENYIMNPRVDITGPFIYDYVDVDITAIEQKDDGGNYALSAADANRTDNINDIERPWP